MVGGQKGYYLALNKALQSLYAEPFLQLAADGENDLFTFGADIIDDAIKALHRDGKFKPELLNQNEGRALIGENFRILSDAIDKGTTRAETQGLKHEIPAELTAALKDNAYIFSSFKAYHTLQEAGVSLMGANGGIKPFEQFSKEAADVFKKQGLNLRAEYQYSVQTAQAVARWHDIEADGDRYDLQYRTVGDGAVRPEHAAMDGTTLPPSDPFWSKYYPPNDWGCRCSAVQVRKGKYPLSDSKAANAAADEATNDDKKKIFRFNAGAQKKIFPDKHPYLPKGCGDCKTGLKLVFDSKSAICKACQNIDAAKVKISRDYVRNHFKNVLQGGEKTYQVNNGAVKDITVSYQDIKNITGKPHAFPYARNMAAYYLPKVAQQGKYLGSSPDAKGTDAKGHTNVAKWHYIEFPFLGKKSVLIIKEYADGTQRAHTIQDGEHFEPAKIKNKAK